MAIQIAQLLTDAHYMHSRQVSRISTLLASKAGCSANEQSVIEQAALLHDIGKSDVPDRILNKPGPLTPQEYAIVKTHTERGYERIERAITMLQAAALVAQQHHERLDGQGYMALPGVEISPYARLIAVADVFDALYSRRPYKEAWPLAQIGGFFREQSGRQFEPEFVAILLSCLDEIAAMYTTN